jgi:ankyrin repeat protein
MSELTLRPGRDDDGYDTALHKANTSYFGNVQVVKELLVHGGDIEAEDIRGWTPLHWACNKGYSTII